MENVVVIDPNRKVRHEASRWIENILVIDPNMKVRHKAFRSIENIVAIDHNRKVIHKTSNRYKIFSIILKIKIGGRLNCHCFTWEPCLD